MITLFYILIAIFIAWIWIDYFIQIDIYEKDSFIDFFVTFLLGSISFFVVFGLENYVFNVSSYESGGNYLNDFLYSVLKIGLVEEIAKLLPFIILFKFFSKKINEPVDYIVLMSIAALGFSASKNIINFNGIATDIIKVKAILSTFSQMFNTSLIAYGVVLLVYKGKSFYNVFIFFLLAVLSHGFYHFWMFYYDANYMVGLFITVFYFLLIIEIYAIILNNSLNNSTFFSYKKVINSSRIFKRLISFYVIVFLAQIALLCIEKNLLLGLITLQGLILPLGTIIGITAMRLSRFKLIEKRWNEIGLYFPFFLIGGKIVVKGDSYNEALISRFFNEYVSIRPLSYRNTHLGDEKVAFVQEKVFLKYDETFYLVKVFENSSKKEYQEYLLKPKTGGLYQMKNSGVVFALLEFTDTQDVLNDKNLEFDDFAFLEWCVVNDI